MEVWYYRISSKSCRGEILFQGSVWCGDNSRAASTEINTQARTQLQYLYARKMRVHIRKLLSIPYHAARFRGAVFIGTSWQIDAARFRGRREFEVRRDFEEIQYFHLSLSSSLLSIFLCLSSLSLSLSDRCELFSSSLVKVLDSAEKDRGGHGTITTVT